MKRSVFTASVVVALTLDVSAQPVTPAPTTATPPPGDPAKPPEPTTEAAAIGSDRATAASATVSSGDLDLSALGLDPSGPSFDDRLAIYGFADIGYSAQHWSRNPIIAPQDPRGFAVGNFNLYLAKNLTPRARALAEVRFTFLPNGTPASDGSSVNTTVMDPDNLARPVQWGGVVIERAYAEYDLTEHLTIRGGHWLTPYGIWNIDHGSPAIVGIGRPYIVGQEFFPEHQTGLDLFGSHYEGGFQLNVHLTASNGRGGSEAQVDQDSKLAFGGRVDLETPWGLKAGGSYYRGRYTGLSAAPGAAADTYLEAAYGGDAQFDHDALHLQAEVIVRDRHYPTAAAAAMATGGATASDPRDFGIYILAGHRFDRLWNVMPFAYYEDYRPADHALYEGIKALNLGLNFRPTAGLVFKLQGTVARIPDGVGLFAGDTVYVSGAQASWVF